MKMALGQQQQTEFAAWQAARATETDFLASPLTERESAANTPVYAVPSNTELDRLLKQLNSFREANCATALREATQFTRQPHALLRMAQREAYLYRKSVLRGAGVSLIVVGLAIANALYTDVYSASNAWFGVSIVALSLAGWLSLYIPRKSRSALIGILSNLDDPRFLGTVLTMLVPDGITEVKAAITPNRLVRTSIMNALLKMLPSVRADHAETITRDQMQTLLILMMRQYDLKLTVAILRALQQIGAENALSAVKSLVASRHNAVSEAAQETLEYLNLRSHQKRQAQTLLRASDNAAAARPEHMLRPANPVTDTTPEQLLRPS